MNNKNNTFFEPYIYEDVHKDIDYDYYYNIGKKEIKPYYDEKRKDYTQDYNVQVDDLNRLLNYSRTDFARELANQNKTFARILNKKLNSFNSRNIVDSGIAKSDITDDTRDFQKTLYNMQDYQKRKEEDIENRKTNLATKYNRFLRDLKVDELKKTYFIAGQYITNRKKEDNIDYMQKQKNSLSNTATPTDPKTNYNGKDVYRKTVLGKTKRDIDNENAYKKKVNPNAIDTLTLAPVWATQ